MSERFFRYVNPWRVRAYAALGWNEIGECASPHDGRPKVIMEWINAGEPVEPLERTVAQISAEEFVGGLVFEGNVVTSAAPIVAYMAKQRWTRRRVQNYCRRHGWSFQAIAPDGAQAGRAEQAAVQMAHLGILREVRLEGRMRDREISDAAEDPIIEKKLGLV